MWMMREVAPAGAGPAFAAPRRRDGMPRRIVASMRALPLSRADIVAYLTDNISFAPDETMQRGMRLYFELAYKQGLIDSLKPLRFSTRE